MARPIPQLEAGGLRGPAQLFTVSVAATVSRSALRRRADRVPAEYPADSRGGHALLPSGRKILPEHAQEDRAWRAAASPQGDGRNEVGGVIRYTQAGTRTSWICECRRIVCHRCQPPCPHF